MINDSAVKKGWYVCVYSKVPNYVSTASRGIEAIIRSRFRESYRRSPGFALRMNRYDEQGEGSQHCCYTSHSHHGGMRYGYSQSVR